MRWERYSPELDYNWQSEEHIQKKRCLGKIKGNWFKRLDMACWGWIEWQGIIFWHKHECWIIFRLQWIIYMATHLWRKLFQREKLPLKNVSRRIDILQNNLRTSYLDFFTFVNPLQKYYKCAWMGWYRRSPLLLQWNWICKKSSWLSWKNRQPSFPLRTFAEVSSNYCPIFRGVAFYCVR